jgi:hypothetical protein
VTVGGGGVVVGELDELSWDLEVDGEEVRRTLGRRILERRGWATVAILFEERGAAGWRRKVALLRMQRARGAWRKHAMITLAAADAAALGTQLGAWAEALGGGDEPDDDGTPGDAG